MIDYGTETHMRPIDKQGSYIYEIDKYNNSQLRRKLKRYSVRIKVCNKQEETTEFLNFSDMMDRLQQDNRLMLRGDDPSIAPPTFVIEYQPGKTDFYFIIRTHTEIVI